MDIMDTLALLLGDGATAPASDRRPKRKKGKRKRQRKKEAGPVRPMFDTLGNQIGTRQQIRIPERQGNRRQQERDQDAWLNQLLPGLNLRATRQVVPPEGSDPNAWMDQVVPGLNLRATREVVPPMGLRATRQTIPGPPVAAPSLSQLLLQSRNTPPAAIPQMTAPDALNAAMRRRKQIPQSLNELLGL